MRLPTELAGLAPEADLRTVVIRRQDHLAQTKPAQSERPDGLFFTKGLASAEGFRPAYWSYGKAYDSEAGDACAVVEVRTGVLSRGEEREAAAIEQAETVARSSAAPQGRLPHEDDARFSELERAFLDAHRQALMRAPEAEPDGDGGTPPETPSATPGPSDTRPPLADLRVVQLRRSRRDTARVDELLVRKGDAGAATPSSGSRHGADATADAAEQTAPVVAIKTGGDALGEQPERPNDAAPDVASMKPGEIRGSSLRATQVAVIIFGCVALLASLGVFIPSDAPPRADAVPPQSVAPGAHPLSAAEDFLARGDERLRSGDVVAARLFYEKAAAAGNAHGALMAGATYDPKFLASIGAYGLQGDEKAASVWYRRAGDLGDPEAANLANNPQRK